MDTKNDDKIDLRTKAIDFLCAITHKNQLINVLDKSQLLQTTDTTLIPIIPSENSVIFGYKDIDEKGIITHLIKAEITSGEDYSLNNYDIYLSSKVAADRTNWVENTSFKNKDFKLYDALLSSDFKATHIIHEAPQEIHAISPTTLKWVAATYRALVKIEADKWERIPAWCNVAMKHNINTNLENSVENEICILSPPRDINNPLSFAYIRDGHRGLRAHKINSQNGYLWRAGIAITDMLGYTHELDKYADVEPDATDGDGDGEAADTLPIKRILRNSLRKINGSVFYSNKYEPVAGSINQIPQSIIRTLNLLENHPSDMNGKGAYEYALLSEIETSMMQQRLNKQFTPENKGELPWLYSRAVQRMIEKVPVVWFNKLQASSAEKTKLRGATNFWSILFNTFEKNLLKSRELDSLQNCILFGCLFNLIESWLKAIVFELEANNSTVEGQYSEIKLAEILYVEEIVLYKSGARNDVGSLVDYYVDLIEQKGPQSTFRDITIMGWFVLALIKIDVIVVKNRTVQKTEVLTKLGEDNLLLNLLCCSEKVEASWPLDLMPIDKETTDISDIWKNQSKIIELLCLIDPTIKNGRSTTDSDKHNNINEIRNKNFQYSNVTDEYLNRWKLAKWQIDVVGENKPYYKNIDDELVSSWTETLNSENKPIYISICGKRYGSILEQLANSVPAISEVMLPESNANAFDNSVIIAETAETIEDDTKLSVVNKDISEFREPESKRYTPETTNYLNYQINDLKSRAKTKAPLHIRAAFIQLQLNGKNGNGYDCPVRKEIDDNPKQAEVDFIRNKTKYVREEARRQNILRKTLETCSKIGVEYLVLPEYSVQPKTIEWLKMELRENDYKISILAGTYRLIPEAEDCFGINHELKDKIIGKSYNENYFKDYQAILTLLVPYNNEVFVLNRAKKYAASAANELINPSTKDITPLFTLQNFEEEFKLIPTKLKGKELGLSAIKELLNKNHIKPLNFTLELICAELFLITNPTNYNNLATEFDKLCKHFGGIQTEHMENIIKDLKIISNYLSHHAPNSKNPLDRDPYRRSIISIPAMTSRKQDYWIFGQGAMLANGSSTIFCNAVLQDHSTGGSCFVGLDSWRAKNNQEFITPYNGWSKGIYYGQEEDALGEEQALVIADIDPLMMSQGKPRPQTLPVPMRLVGYFPIIEVNVDEYKDKCLKIESDFNELSKKIKTEKFKSTYFEPDEIKNLIESCNDLFAIDDKIKKVSKKRIKHWEKNRKINPMTGLPGALTDWILVDSVK